MRLEKKRKWNSKNGVKRKKGSKKKKEKVIAGVVWA